jgi:hypothetical protein
MSKREKTDVVSYSRSFLCAIDQDMYRPGGEVQYNESLYFLVTFIGEPERWGFLEMCESPVSGPVILQGNLDGFVRRVFCE